MRGIFGWLGEPVGSDLTQARVLAMARPFRTESPLLEVADGGVLAGVGVRVSLHREQGLLLALAGHPILEGYPDPATLPMSILDLYRGRPERLPAALHGSFALAILEPAAGRGLLAVDRFGIESLCFGVFGSSWVFASRADALAAHPDGFRELDPQALYAYFHLHCIPSPLGVFRGQRKLMPGQWVRWDQGRVTSGHYWQADFQERDEELDLLEEEFRDTLSHCVAHACADLPGGRAGALLRGGVAGAALAGYLGQLDERPAATFSIGFEAPGRDQLPLVDLAEHQFGCDARRYYVTSEDAFKALRRSASGFDEPMGRFDAVTILYAAHLARHEGVRVLLAGTGGDTLFPGAGRYPGQTWAEAWERLPSGARHPLEFLARLPGSSRLPLVGTWAGLILDGCRPLAERLAPEPWFGRATPGELFTPEFLAQLEPDQPWALLRDIDARADGALPVQRVLHLELQLRLADQELRLLARMGEMAGVEFRFPWLDEALVEFATRLPVGSQRLGGRPRQFLKRALADLLPQEILAANGPEPDGPVALWLREPGDLSQQARRRLERFGRRGILKPEVPQRLLDQRSRGDSPRWARPLWGILALEEWLQAHGL